MNGTTGGRGHLPLNRLWRGVRKAGVWGILRPLVVSAGLQLKSGLQPRQDLGGTIFLCGSPRSGTTWLAELLTTGTGYHALIEPLHIKSVQRAAKVGFDWRTLIAPGTSWPEAEEFFFDLFTGRFFAPSMLAWVSPRAVFNCKGWLVKSVRANRMLPWLVERFPLRGYVLIIRHPCAVIASQLRDSRFLLPDLSMIEYESFFAVYPEFRAPSTRCTEPEEIYALRWCMDQHIPLTSDQRDRWLIVRYEDLVRDGEKQLNRIHDYLRLPAPEASLAKLRRPSREAADWSAVRTGADPILSWKSYLDVSQIKRIRRIVREFELDSMFSWE